MWLDYVVRNQLLSSCLFVFVKPVESCILFLSFVVLFFEGVEKVSDRLFCLLYRKYCLWLLFVIR